MINVKGRFWLQNNKKNTINSVWSHSGLNFLGCFWQYENEDTETLIIQENFNSKKSKMWWEMTANKESIKVKFKIVAYLQN